MKGSKNILYIQRTTNFKNIQNLLWKIVIIGLNKHFYKGNANYFPTLTRNYQRIHLLLEVTL